MAFPPGAWVIWISTNVPLRERHFSLRRAAMRGEPFILRMASQDSPAARQPLGPHLKGDASVPESSPATVRVRLDAEARLVAEYRGNYVQQDGANYAAWHPRREQAGVD